MDRRINTHAKQFYPRDAILCLPVSVTSRCSIETVEQIALVFRTGASFHISYTIRKYMYLQNKGTSVWNLAQKHIDRQNVVSSSRKVDAQSVINWTVVGQLS